MVPFVHFHGYMTGADGQPGVGRVWLQLVEPVYDLAGLVVRDTSTVVSVLDGEGRFTFDVVASSDAGLQPTGVVYRMGFDIEGVVRNPIFISLPSSHLDVDFASTAPYPGTPDFVWQSPAQGPQGPAAPLSTAWVVHGANAATARPAGFVGCVWVGSAQPVNAIESDIWIPTT